MSLIRKLEKQIAAGSKVLTVEAVDLPALAKELDALPEPEFGISKKAGVLGLFRGLPIVGEPEPEVAAEPEAPKLPPKAA